MSKGGETVLNRPSHSRVMSQHLREVHGRMFNLSAHYNLPSDDVEFERLDMQHAVLVLGSSGLTPCDEVVNLVMVPENGQEKRILDLGSGNGIWAIEMARKYPHTSVTGIDLAPNPRDQRKLPPNVHFEIYDINDGLEHLYDKFDVVHMRCVVGGIKDAEKTYTQAQLCVKPGGLIIFVEGDPDTCAEDRLHTVKFPDSTQEGPDTEGSWLRKIVWETHQANKFTGGDGYTAMKFLDSGLWENPMFDPETASIGNLFLPLGPWPKVADAEQSQLVEYVGTLTRLNFLKIHRAFHSFLVKEGMDPAILNEWSAKADNELLSLKLKMWIRFRYSWARRRAGPNLPAPSLPSLPLSSSDSVVPSKEKTSWTRYPFFDIYKTKEAAAAAVQERKEALGPFPESEVVKIMKQKRGL